MWWGAFVSLAAGALTLGAATPAWSLFGSTPTVDANVVSTATLAPPSGLVATPSCSGTSAITYRGAGSGTSAAVGFLAVGHPPASVEGDLLIAAVSWDESTGINAPADWTWVRTDYEPTDNWRQSVFYRFAGPSEPINYRFTSDGAAPQEPAGVIGAYSGVDPTAPIDVQGGQVQTTTYDGPITAPSVTPTVVGTRLVGFFGSTAVGDIAPAPGMTEIRDVQVTSGDGAALSLLDEALTAPGPTGTRVALQSVGNMGIGQLVALRPAMSTSDPVVTLTWTPTASSFASGYTLRRWNGAVAEDEWALTPRSTATFTDDPLVSGTTYDFELQSVYEGWTSTSRRVTITPTCP